MPQIKKYADIPVGVGFGIRDAASAQAVARVADAVVIGSRIIQEIESSKKGEEVDNVKTFMAGIRKAMDAVA
jgi:tryptophan synthase alpha chain